MSSQVKRGGKVWKAVVGVISTVIIVGLFVALLVLTASGRWIDSVSSDSASVSHAVSQRRITAYCPSRMTLPDASEAAWASPPAAWVSSALSSILESSALESAAGASVFAAVVSGALEPPQAVSDTAIADARITANVFFIDNTSLNTFNFCIWDNFHIPLCNLFVLQLI